MVSPGPSGSSRLQGRFILGAASHLDAFSGYLRLPSLPGAAVGTTAGTRAGNPTRSSRTRVRAPQSPNAHPVARRNGLPTFGPRLINPLHRQPPVHTDPRAPRVCNTPSAGAT